jgi:flagellar biosynthetic protein FliS
MEAAVMTAPREKRHLMLIEGALRLAERALACRRAGREEDAFTSVVRAREILNSILCGIKQEGADDLTRRVAAIYVFVFRKLVEAGYPSRERPLQEAIRILRIERETWRQVCGLSRPDAEPGPARDPRVAAAARAADPAAPPAPPHLLRRPDGAGLPEEGLWLEV